MRERNILFELIITNQCNKRCEYCKLDFYNKKISYNTLSNFIKYIKEEGDEYDNICINFFGGEPLLDKERIKYVVRSLTIIKGVRFSIGTNGLLLDREFLEFSRGYEITFSLSVDTDDGEKILFSNDLKDYIDMMEINFVINPHSIENINEIFSKIIEIGYKKINIMPVYSTIEWNKEHLSKLNNFIKYIDKSHFNAVTLRKYSYYNGVGSDRQFIIETNGNVFSDLDSLLWIQKQNMSLSKGLRNKIELETFLGNIGEENDISQMLGKYSIESILNLVFAIPKSQGLLLSYKLLHIILNKETTDDT